MKIKIVCLGIAVSLLLMSKDTRAQFFKKLGDDIKKSINNKNNTNPPPAKNNNVPVNTPPPAKTTPPVATVTSNTAPGDSDIKVYNNYDFVPGETVIFEDHFTNDQDGEFPAQWKLERGQAVMNNVFGTNAFLLTNGNYAMVSPRIKTPLYLTDPFTIELDYFIPKNGSYGPLLRLNGTTKTMDIHMDNEGGAGDGRLSGTYPGPHEPKDFRNKWHHVAIVFKKNQLKVYVDQYRVFVDPEFTDIFPASLTICSIGSIENPFIFSNIRIASGGGMNLIGKKFTDAKIVTHGINFDYNKASLKPESMGTLNMIVKIMNGDLDVKFEVGGHTDGDGDADYNLKLSQQRAEAVRNQLLSMGIDGSRLTAKGFGKSKPIADNTTEEGKANNRRVEFVKQ